MKDSVGLEKDRGEVIQFEQPRAGRSIPAVVPVRESHPEANAPVSSLCKSDLLTGVESSLES